MVPNKKINIIQTLFPSVLNSDEETGWNESGKAEDLPEEPAEKVVGKVKDAKSSSNRKVFKQRNKSKKGRQSTSTSSESDETERKRRKKKRSGRKKKSHLSHHQMFQTVTSQQIRNERLQLLIKDSR